MKKHITITQWKQVCKQGSKINLYYVDKQLEFDKMNIGGMIEFLEEDIDEIMNLGDVAGEKDLWQIGTVNFDHYRMNGLCNTLWEMCIDKLK